MDRMSDVAPGRVVPIPHGTYSGYTNHGCRCDECRQANSAYMREYRERTNHRWDRKQSRARSKALALLAAAHPQEYAELLNNQRAMERLPPVGADGRGPAVYIEAP
jgi:hypothetical protein